MTKPHVLLVSPSALDCHGTPIKLRRLYLRGLTPLSLAAVTPGTVDLTLVSEPIQDLPLDRHWDLAGLTGSGVDASSCRHPHHRGS